jgi:hypothetical protein
LRISGKNHACRLDRTDKGEKTLDILEGIWQINLNKLIEETVRGPEICSNISGGGKAG